MMGPCPAYLVVSNAVLLVRRAQRDGGYDCPGARIWVRPDVDGAGAKAVQCLLVELLGAIQVDRSVDGGSEGDWGHDIVCGSRGSGWMEYSVIIAVQPVFLYVV